MGRCREGWWDVGYCGESDRGLVGNCRNCVDCNYIVRKNGLCCNWNNVCKFRRM